MPSVLETFYLLFESNTDQVKKGVDEATHATGTFEQGVAHMDAAVEAAGERIIDLFTTVAIRIASAFAIEELAHFVGEVSELNAQLGITAERLGINVEDLDAWGQATRAAGGSVEGFTQSLDFLNRGVADIATKGTSRLKPFFDELKIRVTDGPHQVRPLLDILGDLSDKLSKLSAQQRAGIAEKLGLDPGTVLLLAQGRRGVEDLVERQKELGVVTAEDAEQAHKYNESLEDLEHRFHHIATEAGSSIFPMLIEFFNWIGKIIDYLSSHRVLVEGFFIGVAAVIGTVYLPTVVEAAVATWTLLAPFLAIAIPVLAAAAAIALLTDDVHAFLNGNKSVIGEISKTWPQVGEFVRSAVRIGGEVLQWFFDLIKNGLGASIGVLRLFGAVVGEIARAVSATFGLMGLALGELSTGFAKAFPLWSELFGGLVSFLKMVGGLIADIVSGIAKIAGSAILHLPETLQKVGKAATVASVVVAAVGAPAASAQVAQVIPAPAGTPTPTPRPDPLVRRTVTEARTGQFAALPRPQAETDAPATERPRLAPPSRLVAQIPAAVTEGVVKAQVAIHTADRAPLSAVQSSINAAKTVTRNITVEVGGVTIVTQATDPDGILKAASDHLDDVIRQAVDHHDDGLLG